MSFTNQFEWQETAHSSMQWPSLEKILAGIEIPNGFEVTLLSEAEIDSLIEKLKSWYPDIATGSECAHLERNFYFEEVHLKETVEPRDVWVAVVKYKEEIIALYSCGIDPRANWIGGKLTVIAPEHRNSQLGLLCVVIFEKLGRLTNAGMLWVTCTLRHPYTQRLMEKCGFSLCGIVPAYDRDFIDGQVKYVSEALYVKVLADPKDMQEIHDKNLSNRVRALHTFLNN